MPDRILRRLSTSRRRDTLHILLVGISIGGVIALASAALKTIFYTLVFTLHSVNIPDHQVGKNPLIVIDRAIKWNFPGQYAITVRSGTDHTIACITPWTRTFEYRTDVMRGGPILKRPLSHWMGGRDVLRRCEADEFGAGSFYLNTCHRWMLGPFPLAKRCVESNTFERTET